MNYNFRVFISSTFDDFAVERNILKEIVWPEMESYCQRRGGTFQPIDLRWGIPPDLANSLDVVNICLNEVKNCKKLSPTPNFISLIGDRYGWRPLPKKVPSDIFNSILEKIKNDVEKKDFILSHYQEDENAIPSEYILLEPIAENKYNKLLELLREITSSDSKVNTYFTYSATHQEIVEGILKDEQVVNTDHYFSVFRDIITPPPNNLKNQQAYLTLGC